MGMMNDNETLLLLVVLGAAAFLALTLTNSAEQGVSVPYDDSEPPPDTPATDDLSSIDGIMAAAKNLIGAWRPPAKYAAAITSAEQQYNLPPDMLARLLWQESRYREDIITGATRSPAGALGIAQFMPATARDMGIDPLNTAQAIPAAARYLASLYRQTGTWTQALAAYNWGIGNVQRKGIGAAPVETRNYFTQILADVNASNGTTWA